jgi:hypothetical protein
MAQADCCKSATICHRKTAANHQHHASSAGARLQLRRQQHDCHRCCCLGAVPPVAAGSASQEVGTIVPASALVSAELLRSSITSHPLHSGRGPPPPTSL